MTAPRRTTAAIFAAPGALAVLSAGGLASALFGDGLWDAVSWLALGTPIAAATYFMLRQAGR
jgi:hypothetical protein